MKREFLSVLICLTCLTGCGDGLTITVSREMLQSQADSYFPLNSQQQGMKDLPVLVTLSHPEVLLESGQNRIGLKVDILAEREAGAAAAPTPPVDVPPVDLAPADDEEKLFPTPPSLPGPRLPPGPNDSESRRAVPSPPEKPPLSEKPALPEKYEGSVTAFAELTYRSEEGAFYLLHPQFERLQFPKQLPQPLQQPVHRAVEALLAKYLKEHAIYTLSDDDLKSRAAKKLLKSVTVKDGKLEVQLGL